jgi:iron complex outermembrane receptor protein
VEAGVDFFLGKFFGLQITRFDQLASGLIQRVAYTYAGTQPQGRPPGSGSEWEPVRPEDRHIEYTFQNVGEITNRGWELKGDITVSALSLGGTFSTVDSRVRRVAKGYTGDLRVGDRMLEVPARTGSVTAALTGASWTGSFKFFPDRRCARRTGAAELLAPVQRRDALAREHLTESLPRIRVHAEW